MLKALFCLFFLLATFIPALASTVSRQERVDSYVHDFVGQGLQAYPNIAAAIKSVLMSLPQEVFDKVAADDYPVLMLEMPHFGGGRWANSNAIIVEPNDPPTFTKGMWIMKLSTQLEEANNVKAIEGIVLHELAHFYLGHQAGGSFDLQKEKDANRLVAKWGFEGKYLEAKKAFGVHKTSN